MLLQLERPLEKEISLSIYGHFNHALRGEKKFVARKMNAWSSVPIYIGAPSASQVPKSAKPGDSLQGSLQLDQTQKKSFAFPLSVAIHVAGGSKGNKEESSSSFSPAPAAAADAFNLQEALRDQQIKFLSELKGEAAREQAYAELAPKLLEQFPNYLPLLSLRLRHLDERATRDADSLKQVVEQTNLVISQIDTIQLAAHFGRRQPVDANDSEAQAAANATKKKMEERREILKDALFRQTRALGEIFVLEENKEEAIALEARQEGTFEELKSWLPDDKKLPVAHWPLQLAIEKRHQRTGQVLKLVNEQIEQRQSDSGEPLVKLHADRIELLNSLGWKHWAQHESLWNLIRFPKSFPLF